eukprot:scaffold35846_cov72-Phaeocystis_antarctica.AAC.1
MHDCLQVINGKTQIRPERGTLHDTSYRETRTSVRRQNDHGWNMAMGNAERVSRPTLSWTGRGGR